LLQQHLQAPTDRARQKLVLSCTLLAATAWGLQQVKTTESEHPILQGLLHLP
jgi:hypothetical protein